jgi:hypothetical protein
MYDIMVYIIFLECTAKKDRLLLELEHVDLKRLKIKKNQ